MADYRDFLGWRDGGLVFEKDGGGEELFPVLPGTLRRAAELDFAAGRDPLAVGRREGGRGFGPPVPAMPPPDPIVPPEQAPLAGVSTVGGGTGDVPPAFDRPLAPAFAPPAASPPPAEVQAAPTPPAAPAAAADPGRAVRYGRTEDGGFEFATAGGSSWKSMDTPAARELARYLDRTAPPPVADADTRGPQNPGDRWRPGGKSARADAGGFGPPAPIVQAGPATGGAGLVPDKPVIQVAPSTGGNPFAPPAPLVQVGPSTGGSALVAPAPAAGEAAAAPAPPGAPAAPGATQPAGAPAGGAPAIVRPGNAQGNESVDPNALAAERYIQLAEEAGRGTPGTRVEGGTFPTGSTVQKQLGPTAATMGPLERAEREMGKIKSDQAYTRSRADQGQAEVAEQKGAAAEARRGEMGKLWDAYETQRKTLDKRREEQRDEFARMVVDPARLDKARSQGDQFGMAVFQAVAALGDAISGRQGAPTLQAIFGELQRAKDQDIELQREAIGRKREEMRMTDEDAAREEQKFAQHRAMREADYLAALDVLANKSAQLEAEAAAQTYNDADGGAISLRALEAQAQLKVEQAQRRATLEQQQLGTVAQQFQTTQTRVVGGTAGNKKKQAEYLEKAADARKGIEARQQVVAKDDKGNNVTYALGKFAESGEGKDYRGFFSKLNEVQEEAKQLKAMSAFEKQMDPRTKEVFDARKKRLGENISVVQKMGVLQRWDDEAASKIYSGIFSGDNVMDDVSAWSGRVRDDTLNQLGAKKLKKNELGTLSPERANAMLNAKGNPGVVGGGSGGGGDGAPGMGGLPPGVGGGAGGGGGPMPGSRDAALSAALGLGNSPDMAMDPATLRAIQGAPAPPPAAPAKGKGGKPAAPPEPPPQIPLRSLLDNPDTWKKTLGKDVYEEQLATAWQREQAAAPAPSPAAPAGPARAVLPTRPDAPPPAGPPPAGIVRASAPATVDLGEVEITSSKAPPAATVTPTRSPASIPAPTGAGQRQLSVNDLVANARFYRDFLGQDLYTQVLDEARAREGGGALPGGPSGVTTTTVTTTVGSGKKGGGGAPKAPKLPKASLGLGGAKKGRR